MNAIEGLISRFRVEDSHASSHITSGRLGQYDFFSSSQGPANGAILLLLVWHWIGGCNWQHGEIMVLRMK